MICRSTANAPTAGSRIRWPAAARLVALLRGAALDRRLAEGVPVWSSPALLARYRRITSHSARRSLAEALLRISRVADKPRPLFGSAVPPNREQVRIARPLLLAIAARLRDRTPLGVRGIARLRGLLADGYGPFYERSQPGALVQALGDVAEALEGAE
jgi:hypothetical protein